MQIGLRLHDTIEGTLGEKLSFVHGQGFTCTHLALSKANPQHPFTASALTPGYAGWVKKQLEQNHIDLAVLGCYLNLATPDQEELSQSLAMYEAHIRFLSQIGHGVVGTETGAINKAYAYEPDNHSDRALSILIENLAKVVQVAEKFGVIVVIEPVSRHIVYDGKRARKVLDEIQSPNLRILLDPVNLLDFSNYSQREQIIEEAISLLHKEIDILHLKDYIIQKDQLIETAPGEGEMVYDDILRFVKKEKPLLYTTLECTTPQNARESRLFLEKIYQKV
ncbi:MAG: sugar phosphate isomerase/epimerase [Clostridiales bacterium]|nr:sugar phosphate isomerase/epimerase [Clostridiales bacterium]